MKPFKDRFLSVILNDKKQMGLMVLIIVLLWVLLGYILFPALKTLMVSLNVNGLFSWANYTRLLTSTTSLTVIKNSIILGALTVIVCGVVGTLLAFMVNYFDFPFKNFIDKLLLLPVMLPGIIIVFAFVQLYGESGLVTKTIEIIFDLKSPPYDFSGLPAILLVHAYTQYVYFYLAVSIAIKHIDYSVVENARNLGAHKINVFTSVIWPFITPALVTSSAITFMTGIGSFTAPSIIGGRYKVLTTQILLSKANNYMDLAAAQVVILTVISFTFFAGFKWYEGRKQFDLCVKSVPIQPIKIKSRVLNTLLLAIFALLVVSILLPVITIILLSFVKSGSWMVSIYPREFSFENYLAIFTRPRTFEPFLNSVLMSFLAAFLCLIVALPSAYLIAKSNLKLKWLIEVLVMLPWAMPASAIAINIINANATANIFSFNMVLVGTYILLPLGYFVRSIPIMVKTTQISFQNLNDTYIEASKSLGAHWVKTFTTVILPILSPGLLAGFLLVFVRSIGEYTISAFLYTAANRPVSIAMVNGIFEYNIGLAMAYGTLLVGLTTVLSIVISRMTQR